MYSVIIIETETPRRPEVHKFDTLGEVEEFCKHEGLCRINDDVLEPQLSFYSKFLTHRPKKCFVLDSRHDLVDLRDLNLMDYDFNV